MSKSVAQIAAEIVDDANNGFRNLLLEQAADRAVLGGKMKVEAMRDCLDIFGSKCVVDADTQQITLNGLPLDEALSKIIAERPLWQPSGPDPKVLAQNELEAAALAGSVSAHGKLFKSLGNERYQQWCATNAAKPGKAADTAAAEAAADNDQGRENPWLAEKWNSRLRGACTKSILKWQPGLRRRRALRSVRRGRRRWPEMKTRKPGTVNPHKIPIYDDQDRLRGHVGPKATSVTVSRFTGKAGATLQKRDGRPSWTGPSAPQRRRPESKSHAAARGSVRAKR